MKTCGKVKGVPYRSTDPNIHANIQALNGSAACIANVYKANAGDPSDFMVRSTDCPDSLAEQWPIYKDPKILSLFYENMKFIDMGGTNLVFIATTKGFRPGVPTGTKIAVRVRLARTFIDEEAKSIGRYKDFISHALLTTGLKSSGDGPVCEYYIDYYGIYTGSLESLLEDSWVEMPDHIRKFLSPLTRSNYGNELVMVLFTEMELVDDEKNLFS